MFAPGLLTTCGKMTEDLRDALVPSLQDASQTGGFALYQIVAYCHSVGVKSAILIHPETEDIIQNLFMIKGPGDISIEYMSLNLKGLPHELELNAKELISHIRRKYVGQTTSNEPISAII